MSKINKLQSWLQKHEDVKIFEFDEPVRSVDQAVEVSGYSEDQIIKTIIMKNTKSNDYVASVVLANDRVDPNSFGIGKEKDWRMANREEVLNITGFPVGGVTPVLLGPKLIKFVDPKITDLDQVIGGGGTVTSLMSLPTKLIIEEEGTKIKSVTV